MTDEALIASLTKQVESLTAQVAFLMKRVGFLEKENSLLKERLSKYENPKNSRNGSLPPSKDENRVQRNKSLRKKSGRKPGGQKGRKGNTLKMVAHPDMDVEHIPDYCQYCDQTLDGLSFELVGKRQVVDIPEIKPKVTEHQIYKRTCSCGNTTMSDYYVLSGVTTMCCQVLPPDT